MLRTERISLEEIESLYEEEVRPLYVGERERLLEDSISPNLAPAGQRFFVKHAPKGVLWSLVGEVPLAEEAQPRKGCSKL